MEKYFPVGFEKEVNDEAGMNAVGMFVTDIYGNTYVRAKNGAAAINAGRLFAAPDSTGGHVSSRTLGAGYSKGDRTINVKIASSTVDRDEYASGWLTFRDTGEQGHRYRIKSNKALVAASDGEVELLLAEPLIKNVAATQECTLVRNRYMDVVVAPTSPAAALGGVTCVDVPIGKFFWGLAQGFGVVEIEGAVSKGQGVSPSQTTAAGKVEAFDNSGTNTVGDYGIIGFVHNVAGVDGEYGAVIFDIPHGN